MNAAFAHVTRTLARQLLDRMLSPDHGIWWDLDEAPRKAAFRNALNQVTFQATWLGSTRTLRLEFTNDAARSIHFDFALASYQEPDAAAANARVHLMPGGVAVEEVVIPEGMAVLPTGYLGVHATRIAVGRDRFAPAPAPQSAWEPEAELALA